MYCAHMAAKIHTILMYTVCMHTKITYVSLGFVLGLGLAIGATVLAASVWQGTAWITDGTSISAQKIKDNFDFLYDIVGNGIKFPDGTTQDTASMFKYMGSANNGSLNLPAGTYLVLLKVRAKPPYSHADYSVRVGLLVDGAAPAVPTVVGFASPGDGDGMGTKEVSGSAFGIITTTAGTSTVSYSTLENISSPGGTVDILQVYMSAFKVE